ncbi:DUF4132 domain-containing protein [Reinekea forsetii]|nr:DUF4132 domain-containing protein [Reinekea forsetii]
MDQINKLAEAIDTLENGEMERTDLRRIRRLDIFNVVNNEPSEYDNIVKDLFSNVSVDFLIEYFLRRENFFDHLSIEFKEENDAKLLKYHSLIAYYLERYHQTKFKDALWAFMKSEVENEAYYKSMAMSVFTAFSCYYHNLPEAKYPQLVDWLLNSYASTVNSIDFSDHYYDCSYEHHFNLLLNWMEVHNLFDRESYDRLCLCFYDFPLSVSDNLWSPNQEDQEKVTFSQPLSTLVSSYKRNWYLDALNNNSVSATSLEEKLKWETFKDHILLLNGLDIISELGLTKKEIKEPEYEEPINKHHLAAARFIRQGSLDIEHDALVPMLKKYSEQALLVALPYAGAARMAILEAAGFKDFQPLLKLVYSMAQAPSWESLDESEGPYNCAYEGSGVVERATIENISTIEDVKSYKKIKTAYKATSFKMTNAFKLIDAILNIDKEKLEKSLVRFSQISIKAYGLYPIANLEDLKARYLKLKELYKGASQFGQERSENTRAAAKAGLTNLAHVAGYVDSTRLEWAVEAEITSDLVAFGERTAADDYGVELVLEGTSPKIKIYKGEKQLKSVPAKVRKTDIYQALRKTQDHVRGQSGRFKKTLEEMMCTQESFKPEELQQLKALQVLNLMLQGLIFQTDSGELGLYIGDGCHLQKLNGERIQISKPVTLAHVHDLFHSGSLPSWQKYIVDQQIVQPFKQAYRELYVVTPAEVESGHTSRRFAGHVVDGAKASALLSQRRWRQNSWDVVEIYKFISMSKARVDLNVPDAGHYLSELGEVTVDELSFFKDDGPMNMDTVHPIEFSEVMRDIDLIVSVAGIDSSNIRWSNESTSSRISLIQNLFTSLQISKVEIKDHYAFVQGHLAKYRIHLGSGVIHIEPGNYLCVVPDNATKADDFYLPFDETDRKATEIISKIFLLLDDNKIKDKSILNQINEGLLTES